ncbi:putative Disease resistance family protein / LRR family protein [Hibiscus syriacus]|uniref:Disease resistance family protein / LRR family protein n=1 Tax=Hibiscus syriacus TaxID=106335 RepID=A0A6A2WQG2_HIBSY|nr:putative Disease resistance family protein / LRR family protein [Hibiscus syriacus]
MSSTKARLPALLKISSEKNAISNLKKDNKRLNQKLLQLQALLEEKEAKLGLSKRNIGAANSSILSSDIDGEKLHPSTGSEDIFVHATSHLGRIAQGENRAATEPTKFVSAHVESLSRQDSYSASSLHASSSGIVDNAQKSYGSHFDDNEVGLFKCFFFLCFNGFSTTDGGIKAWNVDAKRVVCDLNTTAAFPSVLDLNCSPVEPIFVSVASLRRSGSSSIDSLGYALLTVWNMKTWKVMTVLPLGEVRLQLLPYASITMGRS